MKWRALCIAELILLYFYLLYLVAKLKTFLLYVDVLFLALLINER